jgi:hypothetical protein
LLVLKQGMNEHAGRRERGGNDNFETRTLWAAHKVLTALPGGGRRPPLSGKGRQLAIPTSGRSYDI